MSIGTWFYTKIYGDLVGTDEFGNKYYRGKMKHGMHIGRADKERRWVVYKTLKDPSIVPPYWHAWLHYITDEVPDEKAQKKKYDWQKPHLPNLTGTPLAYKPKGAPEKGGKRAKATGDYEAWSPENKKSA